jgi:hypothetical protein
MRWIVRLLVLYAVVPGRGDHGARRNVDDLRRPVRALADGRVSHDNYELHKSIGQVP